MVQPARLALAGTEAVQPARLALAGTEPASSLELELDLDLDTVLLWNLFLCCNYPRRGRGRAGRCDHTCLVNPSLHPSRLPQAFTGPLVQVSRADADSIQEVEQRGPQSFCFPYECSS